MIQKEKNGSKITMAHIDTQNDENVRRHYNSIRNQNRASTKMLSLRDFNNFVKWLLIFEFSEPYQIVLDMACGKGGDLEKWRRAGIDGFIGIDIADNSIQDAKERYRNLHPKTYWIDLAVGNCFGEDIYEYIPVEAFPVDVVSCQFALHYAFDSLERLKQTLSNVTKTLKPGGFFFGTVLNSGYLSESLRKGQTCWGNKLFKITFEEQNESGNFEQICGNKYKFYLREAVDNIEEYVVPITHLVKLADTYGLEMVLNEPFLDYFERNVRDNPSVMKESAFKRLTDNSGNLIMDPDQLQVCGIYSVFCFKKR